MLSFIGFAVTFGIGVVVGAFKADVVQPYVSNTVSNIVRKLTSK